MAFIGFDAFAGGEEEASVFHACGDDAHFDLFCFDLYIVLMIDRVSMSFILAEVVFCGSVQSVAGDWKV